MAAVSVAEHRMAVYAGPWATAFVIAAILGAAATAIGLILQRRWMLTAAYWLASILVAAVLAAAWRELRDVDPWIWIIALPEYVIFLALIVSVVFYVRRVARVA
jgi:hypothetical protein